MITAVALCAVGAERALSNELNKLDMHILESSFGKIRYQTDVRGLYRSLYSLRCADRVLLEANRYGAEDFDQLYEGAYSVNWEDFIPRGMHVVITKVRCAKSKLFASSSIQGIVHKAVAQKLCRKWGVNHLDENGEGAELRVYMEKDQAQVLLDLSGLPLFKRGYRTEGGIAPLRETCAAAILLLSGWKRKFPLYDPFCGSGTIAIEAALYGWDVAPGLGRSFSLENLVIADKDLEQNIREELKAKIDFTRRIRIYGSDMAVRSVSIAQSNTQRAYELAQGKTPGRGIRPGESTEPFLPRFEVLNMRDAKAPQEDRGFLITNPPYGERLGDPAEAEKTYGAMQNLVTHFPGWTLAVITNHPGFESHFGYAADKVRNITNGALRSFLYQYHTLGSRAHVHHSRT